MSAITRKSPAKINLTLRVGAARADGFHEIESLIARVGLCDTVAVALSDDGRFSLTCDDPSIPTDETNLAMRAARLLADTVGKRSGVNIHLAKCIPVGAGLGGGSSNAATVLMMLNELWNAGLSRDELAALGSRIGSDVPLFLYGPVCIVKGRGEQVCEVDRRLEGWVVLAMPGIFCGAGQIYTAWDRLTEHANRPPADSVLSHAASLETLALHLYNDLEAAALSVNVELRGFADKLSGVSDGPVRMTGSGSAFFRLFSEREPAEAFARRVSEELHVRAEVAPIEG